MMKLVERFCLPLARATARLGPGLALAGVLVACQNAGTVRAQVAADAVAEPAPIPTATGVVLQAMPACEAGGTAELRDGLTARFVGADPDDPEVCLVWWRGKEWRYLAGFWGSGRYRRGTPAERAAMRDVLLGPVGATASFEDTRAGLWGRVTAEHVANPVLALRSGPRRTILVRMIKHDAFGRPNVQAETLHWIDARTGIALQRQVVTHLANGESRADVTWRIEDLAGVRS
jgi:hypothetical protein